MAENSNIEWTTHTFNPWRGCTKVSEGCKHCYADTLSKRNPLTLGVWGPNGTRVVASEAMWKEPVKWNKSAACTCGITRPMTGHWKECPQANRPRVFCASLADVFEDWTGPMVDHTGFKLIHNDNDHERNGLRWIPSTAGRAITMQDVRRRLFELIDATPNLDWLLLTKRPENIERMMPQDGFNACITGDCPHNNRNDCTPYRPNLWLGTSVENQKAADERVSHLLKVPAAVRFLSCEPLLGPVDLKDRFSDGGFRDYLTGQFTVPVKGVDGCPDLITRTTERGFPRIHWVIAGGESGPGSRPMHPDWARGLRDQCQTAGVAFHFKQWGNFASTHPINPKVEGVANDGTLKVNDPGLKVEPMADVGKKAAGRNLDGRTWDEFPAVKGGAS